MNLDRIIQTDCLNVPAPLDPRCADPAFALANPDVCPTAPILILKPAVSMVCVLGSIQFKAFLRKNGAETDVSSDTIFSSSDPNLCMIGAVSGNATGLQSGNVTITATYQDMTAFSDLTILADPCCSAEHVAMLVLVDNSKSMGLAFGAGYSTRLAYAKAAATRFITEVNATKDTVGLTRFNAHETVVLSDLTDDTAAAAALVPTIAQTQQSTTFYDALSESAATLNAATADRRILVIISDGEDQTPSYLTNNPIALLDDFKSTGGIVICLGCRASGRGYAILGAFATGGFFLNGYPAVASAALDFLSGLKGYLCAGNCTPAGDDFVAQGKLDYSDFTNWNVVDGHVDLLGNGFFDVLPGNGLYVDMAGSTAPYKGALVSKVAYSLTSGHTYRLAATIAGNQRVDATPESLVLRAYYLNGGNPVYLLNQTIFVNDYTSPFTEYAFTFTAPGDLDVYLSIQQADQPAGGDDRIGLLLNGVQFRDTTSLVTLLDDAFEDENLQYVPPACGIGTTQIWFPYWLTICGDLPNFNCGDFIDTGGDYGYAVGYNCYGAGCLDSPPPAQLPDPSALADIEAGYTPPHTFSSTKTACVNCGEGFTNIGNTLIEEATDYAFALPLDIPVTLDAAEAVGQYRVTLGVSNTLNAPSAWIMQGSVDGSSWVDLDTQSGLTWAYITQSRTFLLDATATYQYFRLHITAVVNPSGDAYTGITFGIYAPGTAGQQVCATATAESENNQGQADTDALTAATAAAQAQLNCVPIYTATEQAQATCAYGLFPVTASATATSLNSQQDAIDAATAAAQAAADALLDCSQSTNGSKITINSPTQNGQISGANPYPAVKQVTGGPASIASVTVSLTGFAHAFPEDVQILLVSPAGTKVLLMANCGGSFSVSGVDLVFDDAAGSSLPDATIITSGTYKPTTYGPQLIFQSPAPTTPYGTVLADFVGEAADGQWALFVIDVAPLDDGQIAGGFNLTIT